MGLIDEAMGRGFVMLGTNLHYAFLVTPLDLADFKIESERATERWEVKCLKYCSNDPARRTVLSRVFGLEGKDEHIRFESRLKNSLKPAEQNKLKKL